MANQRDKAAKFEGLHRRSGAFIIANPWDAGSARVLDYLGFEALATTSAGFAQTLGRLDGCVTLDEKLEHCRALCAVTELPVSADLENGFADDPQDVARTITRAARCGLVGSSIEDFSGDPARPICDFSLAVERVAAAVEAAQALDFRFTLTARADNQLYGVNDLDDTIRRLQAFAEAGADVLYAPGLRTLDELRAVTSAAEKPVNVLAPMIPGATVAELAAAGAKRISIGAALARALISPMLKAGREMLENGSFSWVSDLPSDADVNAILGA